MLDFSFSELAVVGTIALVVLGPERLPDAARTAGRWVGKVRRFTSQMQQELTSQLDAEELRKEFTEHQHMLDQQLQETRQALMRVQQDARSALSDTTAAPKTAHDGPVRERDAQAHDHQEGMLFPAADSHTSSIPHRPASSPLTAADAPRPTIAAAALQPSCCSSSINTPTIDTPLDVKPRNADES